MKGVTCLFLGFLAGLGFTFDGVALGSRETSPFEAVCVWWESSSRSLLRFSSLPIPVGQTKGPIATVVQ
jgi:hypothetical protein